MIPNDVVSYLESVEDAHTKWARDHAGDTAKSLSEIGIAPDSTIAELYTRFGWSFRTRSARYELLAPSEIAEWTGYAHDELGVPRDFIALTSNEGQGIFLMDRNSGTVYDVAYGQFDSLENGTLPPVAESFADFLVWYVGDEQRSGT
ncbi:hypothetical protein [Novipirellula sp.]|uniref:hypothetical protein n=1 Tax=Novipirellula sp. TaxID=2795430 RepID=UPI003562F870